jgi:lipopolysaccharide transport system ATP-binding protein
VIPGVDKQDFAINVEKLDKVYRLYDKPMDRLKEALNPGKKKYHRDFYALSDVSFTVHKGETVGIIGKNGSGKSTLLKIITGILTPTSGEVTVNGRVAALLELGAGFNQEYTGVENVYLQGTLAGYSREEMESRLPAILEFADIGEFVHQPVKTYSSGMFVRLAFAVAINVDPDILIVDEALSVGDMNFQAKCMTAFMKLREKGMTVLFVSHDMGSIKSICSRAIYLDRGTIQAVGHGPKIAELYIRTVREEMNGENRQFIRTPAEFSFAAAADQPANKSNIGSVQAEYFKVSQEFDRRVAISRYGSGGARITFVELLDMTDAPIKFVDFNQQVKIRIYFEIVNRNNVSVNFNIFDMNKINVTGGSFRLTGQTVLNSSPGTKYIVEYCLKLPLQEGNYSIMVNLVEPLIANKSGDFIDVVQDSVVFSMQPWDVASVWSKVHLFPAITVVEVQNAHN